jgi:hypothetical protein
MGNVQKSYYFAYSDDYLQECDAVYSGIIVTVVSEERTSAASICRAKEGDASSSETASSSLLDYTVIP